MAGYVIVDSNALVAAADTREANNRAVAAAFRQPGGRLVVPALCVCEAAYLVERNYGPLVEARFLEGISSMLVIAPERQDWARIAELVLQYREWPLGGTDASIVALAERLKAETIITLDRRHFERVRPRHIERFRLLPG